MSLRLLPADHRVLRFPRVSGDEPFRPSREQFIGTFSPRERG